jgi:hypothetical protein
MITKKEEAIYNSFLYVSRTIKNKPVKLRQDFTKIADKDLLSLKKLSSFFSKHTHINYNDWFTAPFKVYNETDYFDLQFFNTRRALKCYALFMKQKETEDPDSESSISRLKECISFLYTFCKEQNITLREYRSYIDGNLPVVIQHLKDHKINFYTLHAIGCDNTIKSVESNILNFIVEDFWTVFSQTRTKFVSSKILKEKARKGMTIIENKLVEKEKQ